MVKKHDELEQQVAELTADLQRMRADFENYRKRVDAEKQQSRQIGESSAIVKILPIIDTIERAVTNMPEELQENNWAKGVAGLVKQLETKMKDLGLEKIPAEAGTAFDPEVHQAIQVDETADGETEVVAEELQSGYKLNGSVIRDSMVKVTRK